MEDSLPLYAVQVVSTRPAGKSDHLISQVERLGGTVLVRPTIQVIPRNIHEIAKRISHVTSETALVLTSANAIWSAQSICSANGVPWPPETQMCYCIGRRTGNVAARALLSPIVFDNVKTGREFAMSLIAHIGKNSTGTQKLLFLRGQKSNPAMVERLVSSGIQVDELIVYDTVDARVDRTELSTLNPSGFVVYVFFSPSAVESFISQWPNFAADRSGRTFVVTIGQTTTAACESLSIQVDGTAILPTDEAVVDKIQEVVSQSTKNNEFLKGE